MPPFLGTHLQVRHVNGFSRMMAQNADSRKDEPFWGVFHIAPHLEDQKTQFWGMNRRFQAKLVKSEKGAYYQN